MCYDANILDYGNTIFRISLGFYILCSKKNADQPMGEDILGER